MGRATQVLSERNISRRDILIFVTVGTHEQPFTRLISKIDSMIRRGSITEEVFIQSGYTDCEGIICNHEKFLKTSQMDDMILNARIIITHGGPASIFCVFKNGKIPIVVPRQYIYGEHVDKHQVEFTRILQLKNCIIPVYDINEIDDCIINYDFKIKNLDFSSVIGNKDNFVEKFIKITEQLF
jgi:UDP-N-acetylglucosamine transferase subunit ALG13